MEPFKNLLNATLVRDAATVLQRHDPQFDALAFVAQATRGLEALELKARAMQVCSALENTLPTDFDRAATLIEHTLAPAVPPGEPVADTSLAAGLRGWILWPVGEFIARRGLAHPERALAALHALTQRFTAEFAIRPLIARHPDLAMATLQRWCSDPSAHVRRLVSEGSRPRLPWGQQLRHLIADPAPTLPLLMALQDDEHAYVRRSVANHLNDIAKDHPALVAQWLQTHLPGADAQRRQLLRHASRTLIKQGDPRVLKAWGLGSAYKGQALLALAPQRVVLGGELLLTLVLKSASQRPQRLAIDYAVHHVKADGSTSPKVFKGWNVQIPALADLMLTKRHPVRAITTRRYHAGRHEVAVQANGRVVAQGHFELVMSTQD